MDTRNNSNNHNKYGLKRPSSEQLEDFHVYVVPSNIWREKYNNMVNQDVMESISLGFIRIHPETKLYSLREEIENQLDSSNLLQEFSFLKSVGRCLTKVKQHQEYQLKAKHFLSPYNSSKTYGSELYLLDTSMMENNSSNSDSNPRNSSQATTEQHQKSEMMGTYDREATPKYSYGHKTRNGVCNHNEESTYRDDLSSTSYQVYPSRQTPVSFKQNIYPELSYQNAMKQSQMLGYSPEEIRNFLPMKNYSTSPPMTPQSNVRSLAKNQMMRRTSPARASPVTTGLPLVHSPYSGRRLIPPRGRDNSSDSQRSGFSGQKNICTDLSSRQPYEEREIKRAEAPQTRKPGGAPPPPPPPQRAQEERIVRQRYDEEEKRRRERLAEAEMEREQKDQEKWLRAAQQRQLVEEAANEEQQQLSAKEAAAAAAGANNNPENESDETVAAAGAAPSNAEIPMQPQKWDLKKSFDPKFPNEPETKDFDVTKNKRKDECENLLQEWETIREQRRAKERQREDLVKRAKVLQARSQNKRNHARDIWKKKYYEEKKKTAPLEDQCNKLRQELDNLHRKFMASLDPPKEKPARLSTKKPSEKNNILIQATRLKHETEDLHRRVENAKMKLTAELKLRNQAEVELRALKAELIQQKINLNLLRKQQIPGMVTTTGMGPSSSSTSNTPRGENVVPSLKQPSGTLYTQKRQIPPT